MGLFYKVNITDGANNVIAQDTIIYLGGAETDRTYINNNPTGPSIPDTITDFRVLYSGHQMDIWPQYSVFLARDLTGNNWPAMSAAASVSYCYDINVANNPLVERIIWFGPVGAATTKNMRLYYVAGGAYSIHCDFRTGTTSNASYVFNGPFGSNNAIYTLPWYNATRGKFEYWQFTFYTGNPNYFTIPGGIYNPQQCVNAPSNDVLNWIQNMPDPADFNPEDPYPNIPNSEPSGPAEGAGIPSSDPVDFPGLPSFSATDTGFITLFNPTLAQVKALADYMWNGLFDLNNFKKILADPMDCILGFNMLPVAIPNSGAKDVCIGNIISTVQMNLASSQWVEVNCGQLDLGLPYGSYLDFSPYTKYSIYLPYIGTCDLSADDVAGKVLRLKYHVDVLSCSCVAYLKCGDSVLYQWTGSCGYSIPVTQNDFSRMIMTIVSIAGAAIGGAVTGGAGVALARAGESAAKNVMGLKPDVHRSGSIGSSAGLMGGQTPYLILEVPKACKPAKQYHYLGYPSFTTVKLGDVSGRQDFEKVILDGIPCTEEERDMIAAACEGGIYL